MHRITLDPYLVDTLMPDLVGHDRHPAAFLVYLYLWRQAQDSGDTAGSPVRRSLREISDGTGMSKRSVQSALRRLAVRRLIGISRESITAIPEYRVLATWRRTGS
jgi:hypothetical protein